MMNPPADAPPSDTSIRWEVASAYLAVGAKVGAWALVTALLIRGSRAEFAIFALVRAALGLLNYTSLGLAPAMVTVLAEARAQASSPRRVLAPRRDAVLDYAGDDPHLRIAAAYSNGLAMALVVAAIGLAVTFAYAQFSGRLHLPPPGIRPGDLWATVALVGLGMVLRLVSDAPAAVLLTHSAIRRDNCYLAVGEAAWVLSCLLAPLRGQGMLEAAGEGYALSGALLLAIRLKTAHAFTGVGAPRWALVKSSAVRQLLAVGGVIAVAQLADFLYAPTDFILINRLIDPLAVAIYAPAVQIDSALLLIAGGVASVLLPRAALAYAAGNREQVRRYYLKGTLVSTAALAVAAMATWACAPLLLRLWLGKANDHLIGAVLAILPLVLVHTVIGGSSAVGRSVLLAMGRAKAYAGAALIAGAGNAVLSFCFVKYAGLGLNGIIAGTIIAVAGRCWVWMPWYTFRALGQSPTSAQELHLQ
jgi:O-antigen/teichoic acid export membrane protein